MPAQKDKEEMRYGRGKLYYWEIHWDRSVTIREAVHNPRFREVKEIGCIHPHVMRFFKLALSYNYYSYPYSEPNLENMIGNEKYRIENVF